MDEKPQETVSVEFAVGIGDGKFTATAVVPAGQTNLTQILPVLQSLDDSLISGVTAQLNQAGLAVSCKAGCGACCRQMVPLSIFEAETLSAWIRTLPESRQEELAGRFHQALLSLAAAGLIDRMVNEDWLAETESARQLALDYFYKRVPCPFLENESRANSACGFGFCQPIFVDHAVDETSGCKREKCLMEAACELLLARFGKSTNPGAEGTWPRRCLAGAAAALHETARSPAWFNCAVAPLTSRQETAKPAGFG